MTNTTPLNEELQNILNRTDFKGSVLMVSTFYPETNEFGWTPLEQELTNLIQTIEKKAREEAVDYFYWRIDCNTLISELEGWRGCIDNAKDQTERHFSELGSAKELSPNNTTRERFRIMSKEVLDKNAPSAVSTKLVLSLIRYHLEKDQYKFKEVALDVAEELRLNGKWELYEYILAQYGLVRTFEVTD